METLLAEETVRLFSLPSEKRVYSKRNECALKARKFLPFRVDRFRMVLMCRRGKFPKTLPLLHKRLKVFRVPLSRCKVCQCRLSYVPHSALRKHSYSNILKILPPKNEKNSDKKSYSFHIFAQNIDRGYSLELPQRGGSNEYLKSMFWAEIGQKCIPLQTPVVLYKSGV